MPKNKEEKRAEPFREDGDDVLLDIVFRPCGLWWLLLLIGIFLLSFSTAYSISPKEEKFVTELWVRDARTSTKVGRGTGGNDESPKKKGKCSHVTTKLAPTQ